jgi:hypothetical protein
MKATWKYFWLTVKHKWFVFRAGLKVGAKLRDLITHDLSKFRWSELPHYGRQFFGKADDPKGFINCWLRHQNRNRHHWEYWIPRTGHNRCEPPYPDMKPIPMPERYVREMVADWLGASRAYEGKWPGAQWPWLEKNWLKIQERVHPATVRIVMRVLRKLDVQVPVRIVGEAAGKREKAKGRSMVGPKNKDRKRGL